MQDTDHARNLKHEKPQSNAMPPASLVVGLMSGTSLDDIDAVLLRLRGSGQSTRFEELAFEKVNVLAPDLRRQ